MAIERFELGDVVVSYDNAPYDVYIVISLHKVMGGRSIDMPYLIYIAWNAMHTVSLLVPKIKSKLEVDKYE